MAFIPSGSNPKPVFYQVESDSDLVAAPAAYGSLSLLLSEGFGGGVVGYILGPADPASNLEPCAIYSRGGFGGIAGRSFQLMQGINNKVLVLTAEGSPNANIDPLRGLLYVDIAADPGGNGSIVTPFQTVQQALNVALANTTIYISAGIYVENITMPDVEGLAILGSGRGQTILANSGDNSTFSWVRSGVVPPIARFSMSDLTIRCDAATPTNACVVLDANGESPAPAPAQNAFGTEGIFFSKVDVFRDTGGRAAFLRRVGIIEWRDCLWRGDIGVAGTVVSENVGRASAFNTIFTSVDIQFIRTNPMPFGGRNGFGFFSASGVYPYENLTPALQGGVILRGHPILLSDQTANFAGSVGIPAIEGIGITNTNGSGGFGPASQLIVQVSGTIGQGSSLVGGGRVVLPLPTFTGTFPAAIIDFSRATFLILPAAAGDFTVTAAAGSSSVQIVSMNQARLIFLSAVGSSVAGAIVAGSVGGTAVVLDAREAFYYGQNVFNIATGSALDRTTWVQAIASYTVAPAVTVLTPPYPSNSYTVDCETTTPVAVAVTAKTVATVTLTASAGGASGNITINRF